MTEGPVSKSVQSEEDILNLPEGLEAERQAIAAMSLPGVPPSPDLNARFFRYFMREIRYLGLMPDPVVCPSCDTRLDLAPLEHLNWEFRYPRQDEPELWFFCLPCAEQVRLVCTALH